MRPSLKNSMPSVVLLGTSGVGKTTLAATLARDPHCYHYSGDYHIARDELWQELSQWLEATARSQPRLAELLAADALTLSPKVSVDNLRLLSCYIDKLGWGGLDYATFCARQEAFATAEKKVMYAFGAHFARARAQGARYGVCDAGGSLIEYSDDCRLFDALEREAVWVYLEADEELSAELDARALRNPKPICYRPDFLQTMMQTFAPDAAPGAFDAEAFLRFVTPQMRAHRRQRYDALRKTRPVITLSARATWQVRDAQDFAELLGASPCH